MPVKERQILIFQTFFKTKFKHAIQVLLVKQKQKKKGKSRKFTSTPGIGSYRDIITNAHIIFLINSHCCYGM